MQLIPLLFIFGGVAVALWLGEASGGADPVCHDQVPDAELAIPGSRYVRPLESWVETSPFGNRTRNGHTEYHPGIDLATASGSPIYAVIGGTVARVDTAGVGGGVGNGNAVAILGDDGIVWSYLHQSCRAAAMVPGAHVRRGQFIGRVGATGDATGPHLHLQASLHGVPMDPAQILFVNHTAPARS